MEKIELYRQVFGEFRELCASGAQTCSFTAYCREHGVEAARMPRILKDEYRPVRWLPGYREHKSPCDNSRLYGQIYESFKELCARGQQPGSFASYCRSFGVGRDQIHQYLKNRHLRVADLPGFKGHVCMYPCKEVPFEDVIFEEAGFLPAGGGNVITVSVDGRVAVSFPADTDVAVVARFVGMLGKEAADVES